MSEQIQPYSGAQEELMNSESDIIDHYSVGSGMGYGFILPHTHTPTRKYPLTAEQQRVVDTLADYERAYITCNQKDGNYLVLNGDKTERVRSNTVTALIKKGWIGKNGMTGYKLI